jgi:PIN domain nuclease of toxin-antitoxin system
LWSARQIDKTLEQELSSSVVYLSAASVWEMSIKSGLGKLTLKPSVEVFVSDFLKMYRVDRLPISVPHALKVGSLPVIHKDPFDRMLVAQALVEDLVLVTSDARIHEYSVKIRHA